MKQIKAEDSVGKPLAHDVIEYGPEKKKVLFERGHIIEPRDIDKLKDAGNYHVYISEGGETGVHEEEAARRIAQASAGENISITNPRKGRVRLIAEKPGMLNLAQGIIKKINLMGGFALATKENKTGVKKGEEIASTKITPLAIREEKMNRVERILEENKPVIKVTPPKIEKIGAIITGTEVYEGRIEDEFEATLKSKLDDYELALDEVTILPDDENEIREKIIEFEERGFGLILVTGGMAVDTRDATPNAIRKTEAKILPRGTPIFPGNMLMVGELGDSTILGVPAGVLPDETTSLDIILPRILAKEKLTEKEIGELGIGGLLAQK